MIGTTQFDTFSVLRIHAENCLAESERERDELRANLAEKVWECGESAGRKDAEIAELKQKLAEIEKLFDDKVLPPHVSPVPPITERVKVLAECWENLKVRNGILGNQLADANAEIEKAAQWLYDFYASCDDAIDVDYDAVKEFYEKHRKAAGVEEMPEAEKVEQSEVERLRKRCEQAEQGHANVLLENENLHTELTVVKKRCDELEEEFGDLTRHINHNYSDTDLYHAGEHRGVVALRLVQQLEAKLAEPKGSSMKTKAEKVAEKIVNELSKAGIEFYSNTFDPEEAEPWVTEILEEEYGEGK